MGVNANDYERWVHETDYPTSKKMKSVTSYKVHRINGALQGEKVYDYIEVIEISDVENFGRDLNSETGKKLLEEWSNYIGETVAVHGEWIF